MQFVISGSDTFCSMQLGCHPLAVVQYTFTHKQHTEQHNETEYTEHTYE